MVSIYYYCVTDRVDIVRPFAAHLPGIKVALQDLLNLNLTPQTQSTTHGSMNLELVILTVIPPYTNPYTQPYIF